MKSFKITFTLNGIKDSVTRKAFNKMAAKYNFSQEEPNAVIVSITKQ